MLVQKKTNIFHAKETPKEVKESPTITIVPKINAP